MQPILIMKGSSKTLVHKTNKRYSLDKPLQILPLGFSVQRNRITCPRHRRHPCRDKYTNKNTESKSPILVTKGILAVNRNTNTNTETRSPAFVTKSILAVTPSDAEVASVESGTWAWQASWLDVLRPERKHAF